MHPRFPAHLRVALASEGTSYETANISSGGMFVRMDRELPVGTTMSVELGLPDDQHPTPVNVKIVHAAPHETHSASPERGVGMQFVGDDAAFQERLDRYLQSIAANAKGPVRVLLVARDLLHENGWTQLDARDEAGRYCLTGALAQAAGADRAAYQAALQAIGPRLNEPACAFGGFGCHCTAVRWNDREGRTKREVVAKLDEVIEAALAAAC